MNDRRIAKLWRAGRVWAIAAIHGEAEALTRLHDRLWPLLQPGDQLVYLGNLIGHGPAITQTLDELLEFRKAVIGCPGGFACDVVYLRGGQEVMWHKLLQLQFTPDPGGALSWMLQRGVSSTLEAYGGNAEEGVRAARAGTLALTRWTNAIRQAMQRHPGHVELLGRLHDAAMTGANGTLFVNAGLDPARPLERQADLFWWHGAGFAGLETPYENFRRVVRGHDPRLGGYHEDPHKVTLDSGAGLGGSLTAACFAPDGSIVERLEA